MNFLNLRTRPLRQSGVFFIPSNQMFSYTLKKKHRSFADIYIFYTFASVFTTSPDGGIGRRAGLKHQWIHFHAGSIPALGTFKKR